MDPEQDIVRFLPCGDTAFSMELGDKIDRDTNARVIALYKKACQNKINGLVAMSPTFRSLLVQFDPFVVHPTDLEQRFLSLLDGLDCAAAPGRHWRLPLCYDGEFGPDLADVARQTGLSTGEIRRLHAGQDFFIYMMGFLPGYAYMGDLPEPIRVPRRQTPRTKLPRGSVAIAGELTSAYPLESPGGWNLIGRTPVPLFDPAKDMPVLLAPGDLVTFEPVSAREFAGLERDIASGAYVIRPEGTP
jgi:KipI family sensor histidine kinase inhibitor